MGRLSNRTGDAIAKLTRGPAFGGISKAVIRGIVEAAILARLSPQLGRRRLR
jgi:hypothetical protein